MAKPIIKFSVVPYEVGDHKGYRPVIETKDGVFDLDFCTEVVNEKRLQTSPDQLFHDVKMLAEVACTKINKDGRPRGITRLIKWQAFGNGTIETITSPWNPKTCKAIIKPVLLADAAKELDATFQNVTSGIGVRLNDVTWLGAKKVQNVIKIDADFSANGSHMEFIDGDTAVLVIDEEEYALANKSSDVSHAVFAFPEALADIEPGTQALFVMKSRGGVEDGQVYTVKKLVTILASDTPRPPLKVTSKVTQGENEVSLFTDQLMIEGTEVKNLEDAHLELYKTATGQFMSRLEHMDGTRLTRIDATHVKYDIVGNTSTATDGQWETETVKLVIKRTDADDLIVPMTNVEA